MNDNQDFSGNQKRFAEARIADVAALAETGDDVLKALHKQMGETLVNFPQTILPVGRIIMPTPPAPPEPPPPPEQVDPQTPEGDAEHE